MPERNVVSWASLISGYVRGEMAGHACALFLRIVRDEVFPNCYVFGSVLRACQQLGSQGIMLGMQIHGLISKTWFAHDVAVNNALISMYGGCFESSYNSRKVFEEMFYRNSISWNSIISIYAQRGDADAAFGLFSAMQYEEMGLALETNEFTYGSLIAAISASSDTDSFILDQMLARVQKSGFLSDLYVGSALVSGYARFGSIDSARLILEQLSLKNAVSVNGLMVGLVKQKRGEEAADVFKKMKDLVELNLDSYVVLLSALAEFDVPEDGRQLGKELHANVVRTCFINAKIAIGNGLINMYAKCGAIDYASSVFKLIRERDIVSWNTLISGLDQNDHCLEALENFCRMRNSGVKPSNFSLISALSSSARLGLLNLGAQIHCEGLKLALDHDVSVSNALLTLYAESGDLDKCLRFYSLMPVYDQVSWNTMIGALANLETSSAKAVECFMEMMQSGWSLNKVTFVNVLSAVSALSVNSLSQQIHGLALKYSMVNDNTIENALISCYGKCGEMENCEKIFTRMTERRDEISWNSMIHGYVNNEELSKAMDLVWLMLQNGSKLDRFTFATILSACASLATLERGMEVHACQIRVCLDSDVVVGSALVDMYSKCGRVDYASTFFERMPKKNLYSWNSMIAGYARHGHVNKALELFGQMKLAEQPPDHVTFVAVLSACSHAGLVREAFKHFESMSNDYGLSPKMEHFSCMVDVLGRAGDLAKVEKFINEMPVSPNALIWRTILSACARKSGHGGELGRMAADKLLELEPDTGVNYVLLANMHASNGRWENVAKARSSLRVASVNKEAGCSWVTMKDGIHVFVSGDNSHPEKDAVYAKLNELQKKMKDAGYVPQTSFALYDLDVESKEELLRYHSEKLAIAFVLTRKLTSKTIRIMKNLRVCGDCHSAFKCLSSIIGCTIILRDSNRFHHFADGKCSCGDFW
ncbi:hypothetical protein V2J09_000120 [Rumex salicifolius]